MSIEVQVEDGIALLLLNHPPVNALDSRGWATLAETVAGLGRDEAVRVVVIAAEGRGFCAGVDVKELAADGTKIVAVNRGCYDAFAAIYDCAVPVISAVHGFCLGGGIGIAGASDVVIASEDASFGLPEIDRGALGAATHLMRLFGMQKTRRMLYTGEPIPAAEAYRCGGLEAVVPRAGLRAAARALAAKIAGKSPKAMRLAKWSLNGIETLDIKKSYRFEQGFTLELYTSPDSQEARDAFVEKREAKFEPPR
ncbi:MAG: enoyl-CoA hydratase family protein [Deltaproteobacteria bacterium]|nr:enoyl-CoA hydratase family protein [Deltaproteobacteria bacterium]